MLKLTHANYFTKKNKYISSSKLGTFIKDKSLYKRRYIKWEKQDITDALIIGSAVDCLLTGSLAKFSKDFVMVERRSTKSEDTRMQINESMLRKITGIVNSVKRQEIWKELKQPRWKKQTILTNDELGICGMLDFLLIQEDHAIIVDLKTANNIDSKRYYWHCYDYNYYLQMAFYKTLVLKNFPEVKRVDCYHLAVEKDPEELYNCALFQFEKSLVENEMVHMLIELENLRNEKEFKPKSISWKDKILISPLS